MLHRFTAEEQITLETAKGKSLPEKSRQQYIEQYNKFQSWHASHRNYGNILDDDVMILYFDYLQLSVNPATAAYVISELGIVMLVKGDISQHWSKQFPNLFSLTSKAKHKHEPKRVPKQKLEFWTSSKHVFS